MNEAFLSSKLLKQAAPIWQHLVRALGAATRHGEATVPWVSLPLHRTCEAARSHVARTASTSCRAGRAVTRAELIAELAASGPHLRQADAELIVTTVFDQITAALARGERARAMLLRDGTGVSAPIPPLATPLGEKERGMQATLSAWTWQRRLAYKRMAEWSKRNSERALNGPWLRITCGECGHAWNQPVLEEELDPADPFEGLQCCACRSAKLLIDRKPRYRVAP